MKKLKSIVPETVRILGATAFWSATLLVVSILFPVAALCSEIRVFRSRGTTAIFRTSPITV
ncbi:MAG: hypothetical protein ABIR29_09365 [Chthoniobacterales bacterium]